ncbi:hypothetical protein BZA70DRAFT_269651 [Myxozyma melibiosi]|uniref:Uncharacterized protein n=1 Tax=Myxozyma melibiosi TaxID=54550 RepID=A0ABR1EYK5_9ASCO
MCNATLVEDDRNTNLRNTPHDQESEEQGEDREHIPDIESLSTFITPIKYQKLCRRSEVVKSQLKSFYPFDREEFTRNGSSRIHGQTHRPGDHPHRITDQLGPETALGAIPAALVLSEFSNDGSPTMNMTIRFIEQIQQMQRQL